MEGCFLLGVWQLWIHDRQGGRTIKRKERCRHGDKGSRAD